MPPRSTSCTTLASASEMKPAWLMATSSFTSGYSVRSCAITSSTCSATRTVFASASLNTSSPTASLPL